MANDLEDKEKEERIKSACDEIYETIKNLIPEKTRAERIFYVINYDRSKIGEISNIAREMSVATTDHVRIILSRYSIDDIKLIANEIKNRAEKIIDQNNFYMQNRSRISDLQYQLEKHNSQFSKDKRTGTQRVMGYTDRVYRARLQGEINSIAESKDFLSGMIYIHADAVCKDKIKSYNQDLQKQQIQEEKGKQEIQERETEFEQVSTQQEITIENIEEHIEKAEEIIEEENFQQIQFSVLQEETELETVDNEVGEIEQSHMEDVAKSQPEELRRIVPETLANLKKEKINNMINQDNAVTLKLKRAFDVLKEQGIEISEQEKQIEIDYYNQKTQFVNEQEVFNMINIAFNNRLKYEKSKEQEQYMGMSR